MKESEVVRKYYEKIKDAMTTCYRDVLESNGRLQYSVYVWEDGEIRTLEDVQGGNTYLVPRDSESRKLYYVATVSAPCFDPWDYADHSKPENEDEAEEERTMIIDSLCDDYDEAAEAIIDMAIDNAELFEEDLP